MSSTPRVLLVGAYERDNFGDLLFLLVTERYLAGAEVVAAAPFSADMSALLDREIPAYGPLLRDESFDAIWTVGGQVGRVDVRRAYKMSTGPEAWAEFDAAPEAAQLAILEQATGGVPPLSPAPQRGAGRADRGVRATDRAARRAAAPADAATPARAYAAGSADAQSGVVASRTPSAIRTAPVTAWMAR